MSLDPTQISGLADRPETPPDGLPAANALGRIYTSESEEKAPPVQFALLDAATAAKLAGTGEVATDVGTGLAVGTGAAEVGTGVAVGTGAAEVGTGVAVGAGVAEGGGLLAIVSNPIGWIVGGVIVVGGGGYLAYRYFHHTDDKKEEEAKTDTETNVKVKDCDIKPFNKQKCPDGYEAHHLVPDYVLRYGVRTDKTQRIGNMPSLNEGPAICVKGGAKEEGSEHNEFHSATDPAIAALGDQYGLAKLKDVLKAVKEQATKVKPECKKAIEDAIDKAFEGKDPDTLVRTTQQPLVPGPPKTTTPKAPPP